LPSVETQALFTSIHPIQNTIANQSYNSDYGPTTDDEMLWVWLQEEAYSVITSVGNIMMIFNL
jgi:hypothetical protein